LLIFQVIADCLHVTRSGRRPPNKRLRAKHFFKAGVHLVLFDELAPVGVAFGLKDNGAEIRVIDELQCSVFDKPLRVGAPGSRGLYDLRFLLGCEMNFHGF
jgi:hypothetical protein